MNQHSCSLFTSPTRARVGFISPFGVTLLVCFLISATPVNGTTAKLEPDRRPQHGPVWTYDNFTGERQSARRWRSPL